MASILSFLFLISIVLWINSISISSFELLNDLIFKQIVDASNQNVQSSKKTHFNKSDKIIDGIYNEEKAIINPNKANTFSDSLGLIDSQISNIYENQEMKELNEAKIYTFSLNNLNNVNYGIKTQIGIPQQYFTLIVDIKTPNSWVQSHECKNCNVENNRFNKALSTTYKSFGMKKMLNYTHTGIVGDLSEDAIGFNGLGSEGQIMKNFINVEDQWRVGNMYFDGILSLSFPGEYLSKLKIKGIIPEAKVGLFFGDINKNSVVTVGGILSNFVKDTSQIIWSKVNIISKDNSNFQESGKLYDPSLPNWNFVINQFLINDKSIKELENLKISMDSMGYGIKVPKSHFFIFKDDFFPSTAECQFRTDNYIHCNCNNESVKDFPTLNFKIEEGKTLTLKPNDYIEITTSSSDYSKSCRILISLNYNDDTWFFGTILMNIHYLILDYENSKIGFFRLSGENFPEGGSKVILITIIIVAASAVLFTLVYILYKKFVSAFGGRQRNNQNLNESQNNLQENQ